MLTKYVGCKYLDYVSKRNGNIIKGYSLYFIEEGNPSVDGISVFNAYVSSEIYDRYFDSLEFDCYVDLLYDRNGHIIGCYRKEGN